MSGAAGLVICVLGLGFSIFYGRKAVEIFVPDSFAPEKRSLRSWKFHQFWLNFLASVFGWLALLLFLDRLGQLGSGEPLDGSSIALGIVALVGVTGMLPAVLSRLSSIR